MRIFFIALSFLVFLPVSSFGRNVMSWIPIYGINNCKMLMNDATTSVWLKNGLTHVGLQFWVPGDNGEVVFVTDYKFTYLAPTISQHVQDFVTWGNANDVKMMLCIHNINDADFDWAIAKKAFNDYPDETVTNIMTIVNTYGLDGVDVDFEGIGDFSADKTAFVSFLNTLGTALHAEGKELSVDMFSTPCYNNPNPSWESAMAPHVDFMNIMGYNDTHEGSTDLFGYCPQDPSQVNVYAFRYSYIENYLTVTQGVASSKLNYGLPAWVSDWGVQCGQGNLLDIAEISTAGGIAIWDLQLSSSTVWRDPITWDIIAMFKNNSTPEDIRLENTICGVTTSVEPNQEKPSPVSYDYDQQLIKLSDTEGELHLYSTLGVVMKSWNVKTGENIALNDDMISGIYIINYRTKTGVYTKRIYLEK